MPLAVTAAVAVHDQKRCVLRLEGVAMINDYVIITDAASDLPTELLKHHNIAVIPMNFEIDSKSYKHYPDGKELGYTQFYEMLRSGNVAKTSQINISDFTYCFDPILNYGLDILYIAFSSGLSGTYQSSVIAAKELMEKYPGRKLYCVDSRCASAGQGMLVYHAALKKQEGPDIDTLTDWVLQNRNHLCHCFTVNDLNHLKRGGRLNASSAIVGSMLSVKPILQVDQEGRLALNGKVRGCLKSLRELVERMEKFCVNPEEQTIFIAHGDCMNDADTLASMIKEKFAIKNVIISYTGPIIGAHTGPDMIGVFFFGSSK